MLTLRNVTIVVGAGVLLAAGAGEAGSAQRQSARFMYEEAFAREHVLRGDLDAPEPGPVPRPGVQQVRAVIAAYERVVLRYPASAYCDNALWQAAGLADEAARRWNQEQDRRTAARLLRLLISEYPSSSLVPKARAQLAASQPAPATALAAPPPAAPPATPQAAETAVATLREIRRISLPGTVRVMIELDREVAYRTERLDGPARVLFDFAPVRIPSSSLDSMPANAGDSAPRIRVGRHPGDTVRVVLDLDGVHHYSVYPLYEPYRLVVDCTLAPPVRAPAGAAGAGLQTAPIAPPPTPPSIESRPAVVSVPPEPPPSVVPTPRPVLAAAPLATVFVYLPPAVASASGVAGNAAAETRPPEKPVSAAPASKPAAQPQPAAPGPDKPAPPAANAGGGFSLSRQLGLGVTRIVIDPGHGGHDPGAEGSSITEAAVVLDVALRLEKLLTDKAGVDVVMTRRTDVYVSLEERTAVANRAQADLFLSIHANASRNRSAQGVETYFLNFATSPDAEAVAARENASSGQAMNNLPNLLKAIALNNKLDESKDLARMVQQAMVKRLRGANRSLKDLGVKHAPFVVLIGAAMPSVLAEVSFITNGQEGRLLKDSAYRQRIADALFDGITRYQQSLKTAVPARPQQGARPGPAGR